MNILKILKDFLKDNLSSKKPLLLAFSNGKDSSTLLDLLLKCKDTFSIDLHIAHIDHGWREESFIEAKKIKEMCKNLNIKCHFKKLDKILNKNLENESRNQRYDFFKNLYKKYDCQALMLAHQKNDLAETVLKRVLEGSNLFSIYSMKEISEFNDMTIWRPLLKVPREEVEKYLSQNKVLYLDDKTNYNTKFLRAKMRKDIFPFIEENFQKQISSTLTNISEFSLELNEYLENKIEKTFNKSISSSFGMCIDLNDLKEKIELRFLLKKISFLKKIDFSKYILEKMIFWIMNKKPNLNLRLKNANIFIDRGFLFILNDNFKILPKTLKKFSSTEKIDFGSFDLISEKIALETLPLQEKNLPINKKYHSPQKKSRFLGLFKNGIDIYIPEGQYFISNFEDMSSSNLRKSLKKRWEKYKVPSFLRRIFPIIYSSHRAYDFLSCEKSEKSTLKISLKLKIDF